MELENYDEMETKFEERGWNLNALLGEAETWARTCTDKFGVEDFVYEDADAEYRFDLIDDGTIIVTIEKDGEVIVDEETMSRFELPLYYERYSDCDVIIEEENPPKYAMRLFLKR